jgi:phytoene synthase
LYAFSRKTDDLGDSDEPVETRRRALADWRASLERALTGQFEDPIWPALMDTVQKFSIRRELLFAIVDGVEMDLEPCRYESFEDLRRYCYHVASAVGLACIQIWGFRHERACELAEQCGLALQMTNILRDLKEDASRDRIYLPLEDLRRFGYAAEELKRGVQDERFRALMRFEIERTERLYEQSEGILPHLEADGRRACAAMLTTYRALLGEIKRRDGDVFSRPVRLSWLKKRCLVLWAVLRNTA